MPKDKVEEIWVTANRTFVGGPEIGFTLQIDECYKLPYIKTVKYFIFRKWVTKGKERRGARPVKEKMQRIVQK